jgi:hypothetical protein
VMPLSQFGGNRGWGYDGAYCSTHRIPLTVRRTISALLSTPPTVLGFLWCLILCSTALARKAIISPCCRRLLRYLPFHALGGRGCL